MKYEFLDEAFLEAMNDVGRYGHEKYGGDSFNARALVGDTSRGNQKRTESDEICFHATEHLLDYSDGELHDHFGTLEHQLAAAAFNAMMEFYFYTHESTK